MKELKRHQVVSINRHKYTVLMESPKAALVADSREQCPGWEVWRLRRHKKDRAFPGGKGGVEVGDLILPSSEQWGQDGWTYTNKTKAREHFLKIA